LDAWLTSQPREVRRMTEEHKGAINAGRKRSKLEAAE
jgi:hypothetical protein